jgi:MoxR-like ATPase
MDNKNIREYFFKFLDVLERLKKDLIDREEAIDTLGCGFMSNTNVLLIGEPGTAKSYAIHQFSNFLGFNNDNGYFSYLLTKFTEPSEILGTVDINELKNGKYIINTKNKLPEANIVFLDEIFNANSAILNSLLTLINEKKLLIGDLYKDLDDLIAIFGASNHTPTDPLLQAFFDRFPIRTLVKGIESKDYKKLLGNEFKIEKKVLDNKNQKEILKKEESIVFSKLINEKIIEKYIDVESESSILNRFTSIISTLKKEEDIFISDRNLKFYIKMIIAHSMLRESSLDPTIKNDDLIFVLSKIWNNEEQKDAIESIILH